MPDHLQNVSREVIRGNKKLVFPVMESSKSRLGGKIRYRWCWVAAASLLLFTGGAAVLLLLVIDRKHWLYPLALWGAEMWLKACGAKVEVKGLEKLEADRPYLFVSNHRSY